VERLDPHPAANTLDEDDATSRRGGYPIAHAGWRVIRDPDEDAAARALADPFDRDANSGRAGAGHGRCDRPGVLDSEAG
jgi:hypothetical protein